MRLHGTKAPGQFAMLPERIVNTLTIEIPRRFTLLKIWSGELLL
jgi:hypothetical protein